MDRLDWSMKVFLAVLVLAAILLSFPPAQWCTYSAFKATMLGDASSCWEYWLNRYQTLLGAIAAVGAAAVAWVGVQRQLMFNRSQELKTYLHDLREIRARENQIVKLILRRLDMETLDEKLKGKTGIPARRGVFKVGSRKVEELLAFRRKLRLLIRKMFIPKILLESIAQLRTVVSDACDEIEDFYAEAMSIDAGAGGMISYIHAVTGHIDRFRPLATVSKAKIEQAKEIAIAHLDVEIANVEKQLEFLSGQLNMDS